MKLYYSKAACSLAVKIILRELNIPCEYIAVNLKTKLLENGENYKKINPKGSVPALMLDNKQLLTENAVILQYLADNFKGDFLLPKNNFQRYQVLEWLNFMATDLHKSFSPLFNGQVPEELKESIFKPLLKTKLSFINDFLSKNQYLHQDQFTLPDAYLFVMLMWLKNFKIDISQWPALNRYFNHLKQRESIEKSLQEEGLS